MTIGVVVRAGFPGASKDIIEHIVWGMTPYPFGSVTPRELYKVSSTLYRATKSGRSLCDFCTREAVKDGLCQVHLKMIDEMREERKEREDRR